MSRMRAARPPSPAAVVEVHPARTRGLALNNAAQAGKRLAQTVVDQEDGKARTLAGLAGMGGLLGLLFGGCAILELGPTGLFFGLAAAGLLVPTVHAFAASRGTGERALQAAFERGLCQAVGLGAQRLGEAAAETDGRGLPLSRDALINGQLELLYRELHRATQRLRAAGAPTGDAGQGRRHERIVPAQTLTALTRSDGRRYPAQVANLSQSGVALKGSFPPMQPGEEVQVGARRALVITAGPGEAAFQFVIPILLAELTPAIVL